MAATTMIAKKICLQLLWYGGCQRDLVALRWLLCISCNYNGATKWFTTAKPLHRWWQQQDLHDNPLWLLLVLRNILVFALKICLITFVRVRVLFLKTLPNQAHIFINEKNNNNNIKEVCRLLKALPNV
jgi:hypothetical protein